MAAAGALLVGARMCTWGTRRALPVVGASWAEMSATKSNANNGHHHGHRHQQLHSNSRGLSGGRWQQVAGRDSDPVQDTDTSNKQNVGLMVPALPAALAGACAAIAPGLSIGATALAESEPAATAAATSTSSAIALLGPAGVQALQVLPPLAAQVVFLAPLQAMKDIKAQGTTGSLTPIPYVSMAVCGIMWGGYGALSNDMTILVPNISAFVLGSYYTYTFAKYMPAGTSLTPHLAISAAMLGTVGYAVASFSTADALNTIGYLGCGVVVLMFSGPLAVIKTVISEKSTASLPFAFTIASFANCSLWTSYGFLIINDPFIWAPNFLGLLSSIVQLGLFARYGFAKPALETAKE